MKPANQKIMVSASAPRTAGWGASLGKKTGTRAKYGMAMNKVQTPLKSMKLTTSKVNHGVCSSNQLTTAQDVSMRLEYLEKKKMPTKMDVP